MQIKKFLEAVQKDIGDGKVLEIWNKLRIDDVGAVEVVELYDTDGQETGKIDRVDFYYKGDSSVGEGNLDFGEFDNQGTFHKGRDFDGLQEDLGLHKIVESIKKHFKLLDESTTVAYTDSIFYGSNSSFSFDVDKISIEETRITLKDSFMTASSDVEEFLLEFNSLLKKYHI